MASHPPCSYFCLYGHLLSWYQGGHPPGAPLELVHFEQSISASVLTSTLFASTVSPVVFRNMVSAWRSFISNDSSYIIPSLRMVSICFPMLIMYSSLLRRSRLRTSSNLLLAIPDFLHGIRVCLNFRDSMLLLSCREVEVKECYAKNCDYGHNPPASLTAHILHRHAGQARWMQTTRLTYRTYSA